MTARGKKPRRVILLAALACCLLIGIAYWFVGQPLNVESEKVSLDGYSLAVRDYGRGRPTLIIEGGLACTKELYTRLQADLAKTTRVISYDHAGIGESTPSGNPRALLFYVQELRAMLARKGVQPPYILLGHSLGGHIIRYYAHLHPDEVAGLIFVEHPHEDWFRYIRKTWPKKDLDKYFEWWTPTGSTYKGTALEELLHYEENCDLIRGIYPPQDIPVLMFTGSANAHYQPGAIERDRKVWRDLQASLLRGVKDARHIVDWETGHVPYRQKPELFEREISAFVRKIRIAQASHSTAASP